jgi:hypothetical protein
MEQKIKDWLLKGGLPFEMEVSNIFLDNDFMVAQSVYYKDGELGKYRETDIIAYITKKINGVFVNLTFVIECKSSLDKPWIVLQNERLSNSIDEINKIYMTENFKKSFIEIAKNEKFKSDLIFKNNAKYGYSIITGLNSGNDKAYESIQTILKSCEHFVNATNNSYRKVKVCNLYFPLIIIKGSLYCAKMITSNELDLSEIDKGEIILSRSYHEFNNSVIKIFNEKNLENNIKSLKKQCDDFFKNYTTIMKEKIPEKNIA